MAKNVLLIEYEQRDRNRVRSLLAAPDYEVTEAHDGEEGLAAFGSGQFDVVVLSGKLPRMSSEEVIRAIRNKGGLQAPPIVLLPIGYSGSNTKADAQKIGAFEIVPKPFTDGTIVAAVRDALDATDRDAKTVRIPTGSLTANDIFSDLLEELGREPAEAAARPAAKAPAPPPPPPPTVSDDVERRLRDTLSGVTTPPRPAAPPKAVPRRPAGDDLDRIISETLRIPVARTPGTSPGSASRPRQEPPASPVRAESTPATPIRADSTPSGSRRAEPREAVAPEGPDRFGQYELLEKIASGGMAELFRARRTGVEGFQKIVAIKKILPHISDNDEFITMFADEAKLAAELNHPNIVHIYDLGKIQAGGYFIAMEYVQGTDLRSILAAGRQVSLPMPVPLAVYVASKVASALDYAHRRRDARGEELHIVHRDVSPQNILISHEGEIKLCDFGIAKADRKVSQTESGSLKGKLQYMSPEQAWGKPIDHRSDLFSLGTVLHEMLTGERLFRGSTDMVVLELVRKAEVVAPSHLNSDVSAALDAVVLKALSREREARYATGSEMLRDLEAILYSYTPAPGSADVAIYLNRLREAETAAALPRPAEPARVSAPAPAPVRPEATPRPAPPPVTAPPEAPVAVLSAADADRPREGRSDVFGSFSPTRIESDRRKRAPLYVGMAAVLVVGGILAFVLARRNPAAPSTPAPTPAPVATESVTAPSVAPPVAVPTVAAAPDPKAIQQEVQRQLAAKRLTAAKDSRNAALAGTAEAPVARAVATPPPPALPTPAPPEPTEVVVEEAPREAPAEVAAAAPENPPPAPQEVPAARVAQPPAEPEVTRGDLVGPGPGVVEPSLIAPPRIAYPAVARQQRVAGQVVVLVLVNENGTVSDARIQKGIGGRTGIDGVVLQAVRGSRFRAATKKGVPVKMWRTVVVDVKP